MNTIIIVLLVLVVVLVIYSAVLLGKNQVLNKEKAEDESTIKDYEYTNNELIRDKDYYRNLYNQELNNRNSILYRATKAEDKLKAIHDDLIAYKKVWKSCEAAGIKKAITIFRDHCAEMPLIEEVSNISPKKNLRKPTRATS